MGLLQLVNDILFPRGCASCGVEIESGLLCAECRKGLLQMKTIPQAGHLDSALILFGYEADIKTAVHKIKFSYNKNTADLLAREVETLFRDALIQNIVTEFLVYAGNSFPRGELISKETVCGCGPYGQDTVGSCGKSNTGKGAFIWSGIPTDPERLGRRGFDLPTLLFADRARDFGGVWKQTLCRTRKTLPMYGLGPEERIRNLQDCFAVVSDVRGKSVVLADDIFTTGTTFSAAAEVLKKAGAVTVKGLAFCGSVENLR